MIFAVLDLRHNEYKLGWQVVPRIIVNIASIVVVLTKILPI